MNEPVNRPKARRARGLNDRRGAPLAMERALIQRIAKVYEDWGFEPLETPAFEYADALGKFLPDQDRPNEGVFAFQDDDEQWLAMRYDLTAPLARFVAENFDALPKPYRRWAAGPVWRNEKPGPGRFREFWQCDADTVGSASPAADAEMIAMACAALEDVLNGLGHPYMKVSDRRLLDGLLETLNFSQSDAGRTARLRVLRSIDKFDRLGRDGVTALLTTGRKDQSGDFTEGAGLSDHHAARVVEFATGFLAAAGQGQDQNLATIESLAKELHSSAIAMEGIQAMREIHAVNMATGLSQDNWTFDTSIVRGLEYYTGTVFEASIATGIPGAPDFSSFGSVGGGGRYDDLVARFRGERIPATGFSVGVSRLAAALQAQDEAQADGPIVILPFAKEAVGECFRIAMGLRTELRMLLSEDAPGVEVYLGGGGPKAQLKYADKRHSPIALIVGGDELAKGVVTLKDLKLGERIASQLGEDREAYAKAREQVQQEVPRAA
jgi:histidyl-tRNA synthetase